MSRERLGRPDPLSPEYGAIDPDELDRRIRGAILQHLAMLHHCLERPNPFIAMSYGIDL